MNGQIYDPTIGRFLQAAHIQAPHNSQYYNRYSYVLNNPMSYTDPSGYFFNKLFKKLNKALGKFAPVFGIALMFVPIPGLNGVGQAILKGFLAGGVTSGNAKGAIFGAFSAAAFYGIGQGFENTIHYEGVLHVAAHALTGGVIAEIQGVTLVMASLRLE